MLGDSITDVVHCGFHRLCRKITGFLSGTGAVSCCILFEHPVKIGKIFKTGFRRNIQNGGVGSCQQTRGDCQAVVPQIVHERRSHSFFEIPHKMRFGKSTVAAMSAIVIFACNYFQCILKQFSFYQAFCGYCLSLSSGSGCLNKENWYN